MTAMMTVAEARAYLSAKLAGLRKPCSCRPCQHWRCKGTGEVARDWHVWEDLIPAMEAKGWEWEAGRQSWRFTKWLAHRTLHNAAADPYIAAALALQQEDSDVPK